MPNSNPQGNNTFSYFGNQGNEGIKFDKNNFVIQAGTEQVGASIYKYTHTSHEYPGGIEIEFTASQPPILGDSVVSGVLVPRPLVSNPSRNVFQKQWPKPIVNNDPGMQLKHIQRHQDTTWPDEKAWVDRVDTKW